VVGIGSTPFLPYDIQLKIARPFSNICDTYCHWFAISAILAQWFCYRTVGLNFLLPTPDLTPAPDSRGVYSRTPEVITGRYIYQRRAVKRCLSSQARHKTWKAQWSSSSQSTRCMFIFAFDPWAIKRRRSGLSRSLQTVCLKKNVIGGKKGDLTHLQVLNSTLGTAEFDLEALQASTTPPPPIWNCQRVI